MTTAMASAGKGKYPARLMTNSTPSIPDPTISHEERRNLLRNWRHRRLPHRVLTVLLVALALYGVSSTIFASLFHHSIQPRSVSPSLEDILSRCASRDAAPLSPDNDNLPLLNRDANDRFEVGTRATVIKNVTLWTGARNGTEIVYGDILLDKGLVQAIGYVPEWDYSKYDTDVVDAHGGWVTPGLGACLTRVAQAVSLDSLSLFEFRF